MLLFVFAQVRILTSVPGYSDVTYSKFGPYVDTLQIEKMDSDEAVLALEEGAIDLLYATLDPTYLGTLSSLESIEIEMKYGVDLRNLKTRSSQNRTHFLLKPN